MAARTQQLIGTEVHPAFYTAEVQKMLAPYRPELQKRTVVDPRDHAALLAWPIIVFEIVSEVTMPLPVKWQYRKRFWRAYEEDSFLAAKLFLELTKYNHNWP